MWLSLIIPPHSPLPPPGILSSGANTPSLSCFHTSVHCALLQNQSPSALDSRSPSYHHMAHPKTTPSLSVCFSLPLAHPWVPWKWGHDKKGTLWDVEWPLDSSLTLRSIKRIYKICKGVLKVGRAHRLKVVVHREADLKAKLLLSFFFFDWGITDV